MGFSLKSLIPAVAGLGIGVATGNPALGMATYSGLSSMNSAKDASKQQVKGQENAINAQMAMNRENIDFQNQLFNKQADLNKPWREQGLEALKRYDENPAFSFKMKDFNFEADPAYQFRQDEAQRAIERGASARGNIMSGGTDRGLMKYSQNLASQEYGNAFNRFNQSENQRFNREKSVYDANQNRNINMMNIGRGATAQTQQAGNVMGSAIGNSLNRMGTAQAQGYQNIGNANAQGTLNQSTAQNQLLSNAIYAYQKGL